jgi:catalase
VSLAPAESTAAANEVFGKHPGNRALHAKGILLKGTFKGTPEAAQLTRARHFSGEETPATIRFSNGSGHPRSPDYGPDVRGFAVKFYLPDDSRADIVCQTAPRFPVHTPAAFLELLRATKPSLSALWRLPALLVRHPGVGTRLASNTLALMPPASYATVRYHAVHAYRFINGNGDSSHARYSWIPEAGEQKVGLREARTLGANFLIDEIQQRVAQRPVRFALELQIADPGDKVDDPASQWPSERRRVNAGELTITALETEREEGEDILVFDPTRVVDGIELTHDPVLRYRSVAYADSVAQRTGVHKATGGLAAEDSGG